MTPHDTIKSPVNRNVQSTPVAFEAKVEKNISSIPSYMHEVYTWAYLTPRYAAFLDHDTIVRTILWTNDKRLRETLISEISPGQSVLQVAHVYGGLIPEIAKYLGPSGHLDVIDVVPLQASLCQQKLKDFPNARVTVADATTFKGGLYDAVSCFFLLHELPDTCKRDVVDNILTHLQPGGRAVFVDYHRPKFWHPLKGIMAMIYACFEPFAKSLWDHEIKDFASEPEKYIWQKQTFFGGLYQKVVVTHKMS